MPLPVTVGLIVLAVIAIVGVAAYVIDESAERNEHISDNHDQRT